MARHFTLNALCKNFHQKTLKKAISVLISINKNILGVLNVFKISKTAFIMNSKTENIVNMIFSCYGHHTVGVAVSQRLIEFFKNLKN